MPEPRGGARNYCEQNYGDMGARALDGAALRPHCRALAPRPDGRNARHDQMRIFTMTKDIADTGVAGAELTQFVERVERLEEEKKALSDDIRDVFAEMKGRGFDVKVVRQIIKIRKQDHAERMEQEAILELYMSALNMK
jgi:uncharacterized protein (UPF0335 family)